MVVGFISQLMQLVLLKKKPETKRHILSMLRHFASLRGVHSLNYTMQQHDKECVFV